MKVGTVALLARASALAVAGCLMMPQVASAQAASNEKQVTADIPAGALGPALESFGKQAGIAIVYPAEMVRGLSTDGISGTMSIQVALARLLAGTGLAAQLSDGVVNLAKVGDGSGERVLGAVRVQGSRDSGLPGATVVNGVNGSRDVTATEGTGSYTSNALTVGGKIAASIKDTPMAVSVITSQQIQDRNITDLSTAMRDAPGITVLNSGNDFAFWSRGFQITQIQIDGGAPLRTGSASIVAPVSNRPIIDMSLYDHVELVRGATGTFTGYGDPGGVINLTRKRPLDHAQMLLEIQGGSWNSRRVSADITGPLAFDGHLRGRLIATTQGKDYFYKVSHLNRNIVSATLEYDISPSTLMTVGINYQAQSGNAWVYGLPRFFDGASIGLPRSTSLASADGRNDSSSTDIFGQIERRFGNHWRLMIKGTRTDQRSSEDLGGGVTSYGGIDPVTHAGAYMELPTRYRAPLKQNLFEATLDGDFNLFGQVQRAVLGANYSMSDNAGTEQFNGADYATVYPGKPLFGGRYQVNVFNFNPNDWTLSSDAFAVQTYGVDYADSRVINIFANIDLSPVRRLHLATGVRYSLYRSRGLQWVYCSADWVEALPTFCPAIGDRYYFNAGGVAVENEFSWPPSLSARFEISKQFTVYGTYTDIYQVRAGYQDINGQQLPPVTGMNFEGGVKFLSLNNKINVNLSAYYIKQVNTSVYNTCDTTTSARCDGTSSQVGSLNAVISCCYVVDRQSFNRSYGADLEVTGEIRRGWQVAASYTFNRNEQRSPGAAYFNGGRPALQSQSPKHMFKIWSTYDFPDSSRFAGLRVGAGANGQSRTFIQNSRCTGFSTRPDGSPWFCNSSVPVFFSDPGHVIFGGSIGYKLNEKLRIDAEFENLLDKTYYATIGSITSGNWYGAPRSVKVTMRGKF